MQIEKIMKEKGIGATELARRLNVSRMTVYYYIKQDEKNSIYQLKKIASALKCDLSELFEQPPIDVINCPYCGGKIKVVKEN